MRHHEEVRGSVVFFSLCSSIFLLCGHTALITNPPFYFPIGTGSLLSKCNLADATSSNFFRLLSLLSLCKAYRYDWDDEVSMTERSTFIWSQESLQVVYFYNYIVQDYRLCFIAGEAGMFLLRVFVSQERWRCKKRWGQVWLYLEQGVWSSWISSPHSTVHPLETKTLLEGPTMQQEAEHSGWFKSQTESTHIFIWVYGVYSVLHLCVTRGIDTSLNPVLLFLNNSVDITSVQTIKNCTVFYLSQFV